jgi:hypothetical protein
MGGKLQVGAHLYERILMQVEKIEVVGIINADVAALGPDTK